jgi:O-antigen ligase
MKRFISKFLILVLLGIGIFIVTLVLDFFDFSNLDNESNVARYEKMPIAFNEFKQHPFFGVGFGASNDHAFAEKRSMSKVFEEQISPEFGPLTVLSEIGAVGAFFLFYIIFLSIRESARVIKKKNILSEYKWVILISFGGFVSSFLNSNSIASIIVYLFLFIPMFFYKNKNDQSILLNLSFNNLKYE